LLNKFLNLPDHDFENPIGQEMNQKQHQVVQQLIEKVGPEASDEDNLNGASILADMLELKEFYGIACRKANV
jgi:hypothetical protein